ncbi:MAG TPA: ribonuclease H family protein [Bacilli bacterium]
MAKQKYYVVWVGRTPGIYSSWPDCQAQVNAFLEAKYKSYETLNEAEKAFQEGWKKHVAVQGKKLKQPSASAIDLLSEEVKAEIDWDSISVDVGTKGNPGEVEYKGVDTRTGAVVFTHRPIEKGTNNLGEFLAIVHALAFLKKSGSSKTVYSDSVNAINWVKKKQVSSTLTRDETTEEIWNLVDRAVHWLESNSYNNKVLKWQTKRWGEIKADYGRK